MTTMKKKMMTSTRMGKGHKHYKPIQEFTTINNLALDRKIKEACIGLKPCTQHLLMELPTDEDRELIANYIIEWANTYGNGIMMSVNTKIGYITSLVYLSRSISVQPNIWTAALFLLIIFCLLLFIISQSLLLLLFQFP
jgi:hypothetical protein